MIQKLKRWIVGVLLTAVLPVCAVQAQSEMPEELFLKQAQSRSCTLCSATMMLRSCIYINGSDLWQQVTEENVGAYAWTSDGLYWNFSYWLKSNTFRISQKGCAGISADKLKEVLDDHPEGVVLYCGGNAPHAVFLVDYEDGTFYCADPAGGYCGSRRPLNESLLGARHGSQEGILRAVSAYWYVDSHNLENRGYLRQCQEYQVQTRIRVRWDGYAMTLPCTTAQCEDSQKAIPIRCGDYYTTQAVVMNDAGEYWYRVGERTYIRATDAPCVLTEQSETALASKAVDTRGQDVVPLILISKIEQKIP